MAIVFLPVLAPHSYSPYGQGQPISRMHHRLPGAGGHVLGYGAQHDPGNRSPKREPRIGW
jgi:hypothetical protein